MKKIGLLFAGQGSQYINMGHDFYQKYQVVRDMFKTANSILGYNLEEIIFQENDKINQTKYTQAAILVTTCAIYEVMKQELNLKPTMMAGFSLGEYSALYAAGVFTFPEIVELINYRSTFMDEVAHLNPGAMAAIIGLDIAGLESLCLEVGNVYLANYNTAEQLVVGGLKESLEILIQKATLMGAKRAILLNVSGAFHTPLMNDASEKFTAILKDFDPKEPHTPLITNCNAKALDENSNLKELMAKQISSPVLFLDTIKLMSNEIDSFIEIGPGKVLSGFVRRIDRSKTILNIENLNDLENLKTMEGI